MKNQNLPIGIIILVIILTAILVGGSVFLLQQSSTKKLQKTIQDLQKTTVEKPTINKQAKTPKTTKTKTKVENPEIKENTVSLPAGVEWLTYSDNDLSFVYPKTFLETPLQDPSDENIGRTEWKVSRQNNTIYIRPTFESPAAEFGSTYEIEIINNYKDLKELQAIIQSGSLTKNFCVSSKEIQLQGYEVCEFEQKVNEGLGRVGKFYRIMPEVKDGDQPLPWIYIFDQASGIYNDYITSVLIPSLKINK